VLPQGFYSVHGDAALFIARDFYRTLAVVKYLGGPPPSGTPGTASKAGSSSKPSTPAGSSSKGGLASVTLNRPLFEGVLRALLLEGAQHSVELWEGAGANWSLSK
jgi:DNA mismatch repair protein MSH2